MARIYDERAVETELTAGITASTPADGGALQVGDTTGWPDPGAGNEATYTIDYDDPALIESGTYTGKTGTTLTGITRGLGKNGKQDHAMDAKVRHGFTDFAAEEADTHAHDAEDVAFTPAGTISATDVQAAIEEVAAEAGGAPTILRAAGSSTSGTPGTLVAEISAGSGKKLINVNATAGQQSSANVQLRVIVTFTDTTTETLDTGASNATTVHINDGGMFRTVGGASATGVDALAFTKDIKTVRVETLGAGTTRRVAILAASEVPV